MAPLPFKGESKDDFISRCIPIVIEEGTAEDDKMAFSICIGKWEQFSNLDIREWVPVSPGRSSLLANSLVSAPAFQLDYVCLKEDKNYTVALIKEDERLIIGPTMIPWKPVQRWDAVNKKIYYAYMTEELIRNEVKLFHMENKQNNMTLEHGEYGIKISKGDIYMVEDWIVENSKIDKSALYGFKLPKGTYMTIYYVANKELWDEWIKSGKQNGFSIEGMFDELVLNKATSLKAETISVEELLEDEEKFMAFIDGLDDETKLEYNLSIIDILTNMKTGDEK